MGHDGSFASCPQSLTKSQNSLIIVYPYQTCIVLLKIKLMLVRKSVGCVMVGASLFMVLLSYIFLPFGIISGLLAVIFLCLGLINLRPDR